MLLRIFALLGIVANVIAQVPPYPYNGSCVQDAYPPSPQNKVKMYIVNLDFPPEERWTTLVTEKKAAIGHLLDMFKAFVSDWGPEAAKVITYVDQNMGKLDSSLPEPFRGEIRGISNATGLNLGEVVLYNIFYEVFTFCTSIIGEDPSGNLYHARNLDFGLFLGWNTSDRAWAITEALRPCIVNVEYQRGGKTLFKAVHFAGYIGILTGVKPNYFTLTMNERFNVDGGYIGILEWLLGDHSATWMGFLTRTVMENATSFVEARDLLSNTKMLAPAYFILGGTKSGEAVVITRSREKALDVWSMSSAGGWYILETNYDHWEKPLFLDDRRTPCNKCMKSLTQKNMNLAGLYNVLSSKPVLNKLTTYSALMQVNNGTLDTYLQYCPDPCFPW